MAPGFGGCVRPRNHRIERIDRRLREHRSHKRRGGFVMRQRGGAMQFVAFHLTDTTGDFAPLVDPR
jgi:hypothetical protein